MVGKKKHVICSFNDAILSPRINLKPEIRSSPVTKILLVSESRVSVTTFHPCSIHPRSSASLFPMLPRARFNSVISILRNVTRWQRDQHDLVPPGPLACAVCLADKNGRKLTFRRRFVALLDSRSCTRRISLFFIQHRFNCLYPRRRAAGSPPGSILRSKCSFFCYASRSSRKLFTQLRICICRYVRLAKPDGITETLPPSNGTI